MAAIFAVLKQEPSLPRPFPVRFGVAIFNVHHGHDCWAFGLADPCERAKGRLVLLVTSLCSVSRGPVERAIVRILCLGERITRRLCLILKAAGHPTLDRLGKPQHSPAYASQGAQPNLP